MSGEAAQVKPMDEEASQAMQGGPAVHLGRDNRLGTESVGKLLLEFSIPAIIMMFFNSIYNIIDSVFLGNAVGPAGIAVTTLAFPAMMIMMGFASWAGQGGNALAAIQLGQGKKELAEKTLGNSTFLLICIYLGLLLISVFFMDPLLTLIGTTPDLWDGTKLFLSIVFYGYIFQALGMGLNNFLRTAGQPNRALWTTVLGTVSCIIFNYLFVMVLGWGLKGSALATITGQAIGMVPVLQYFIFNKTATFNLRLSTMKPDFKLQGQILALGVASFIMQIASTIVSIVMNQLLVKYGALSPIGSDGALSTIGVVGRCGMFLGTPIIGIIMGAQPLIGFNFGAKQWHRVIKAFKQTVLWSVIIATAGWVLIHLIPTQIITIFGVTGELREYAIWALKVYTIVFPLVGFQMAGSSYFQASGQPLKAAILELTRQVIFLLPLYMFLPIVLPTIVPSLTSLDAMVICTPASDILSIVVTGIFVLVEFRKLGGKRKMQTDFSDQPLADACEA